MLKMPKLKGKKDVTEGLKNQVAQFLLQHHCNGKLRFGALKEAALKFDLCRSTIKRIWSKVKHQLHHGQLVHLERSKKHGCTHSDKLQLDTEKVKSLSMLERSSIRKMSGKLGVSTSTLWRWIKLKLLRPHTNAIKPKLSPANKLARLRFSLNNLNPSQGEQHGIKFQGMHNIIHIDEKWFYMTKTTDRYYLLPEETEPYRSTQSKRFITKLMFMCAVARPSFSANGECIFDGKIGIFPFTTKEPAKRNSKNRKKGTLETKAIQSITKEIVKQCIITQIIPAIKAKWPSHKSKEIIIQQDNAKPHMSCTDQDFISAGCSDGFKMILINQPPNSPDTNINDLGFFRALQSLQDKKPAKTVDDLLSNVISSFEEMTPQQLNHNFLTLQCCLTEIMQLKGGNGYKIPHMNKKRLQALGILPETIQVDDKLVKESIEYLMLPENECGSSYDIMPVMNHYGMC